MQVDQQRCDVIELAFVGCETRGSVDDSLQSIKVTPSKTCQHSVAVVHLHHDEGRRK